MPRVWDAAAHVADGGPANLDYETQETNLGSAPSERRSLAPDVRPAGPSSLISLYDCPMSASCRLGRANPLAGLGVCLLLLWGCGSTRASLSDPLPPGLTLEMHEEFYGITASTAEELAEAMRRLGPDVGGDRVPGATSQEVSFDYQVVRTGPDCRIRTVQVRLEMTTTLPQWLNASAAPAELRQQWEEFAEAVRRHEEVHKEINLAGARDMLRKVSSVSPQSCPELDRETQVQAGASVQRFATENARYDRDTVGGQLQGVVWPPRPAGRLPS